MTTKPKSPKISWRILAPQDSKTSAEADGMLQEAGAVPPSRAAGLFLTMPKEEYDDLVRQSGCEYPDFWIGGGLLARSDYLRDRRFVLAGYLPSYRFGVLAFFGEGRKEWKRKEG